LTEATIHSLELKVSQLATIVSERNLNAQRLREEVDRLRDKVDGQNGKIAGISAIVGILITLVTHFIFKA
jgi:hypothetical protein